MVDFEYLYKGLCGLARAHRANAMAGHLGAAVVAGYFFGEEHHDLDGRVFAAIEEDLDRIVRGEESLWYDAKKAGITVPELFAPFPEEDPAAEQISTIADALSANIGKTRQSGHNVIFASLALRALHDHPQYATPSIVAGIGKLIEQFHGAVPGRGYYGRQRGWIVGNQVRLPADDRFPLYTSQQAMAEVVIEELIRSASMRRQGFGGLFHIINHATGLTELSRFGYRDLAQRGLAAHHHHVRLWRSLPDVEDELGALQQAEHDPRTPAYWSRTSSVQWSAWLTHRIKTLYGFFSLVRFVEDSARRRKAEQSFLYLMA
jgi:hypothetical protein